MFEAPTPSTDISEALRDLVIRVAEARRHPHGFLCAPFAQDAFASLPGQS